ncbi:outer membrane protein assembly factor BamB family protein [Salimicrobium halophilum]|uniref:Outer membrane protein assembly factor BamB, contains PQQ-like beta-propeller repeat n=1 Tax=Salimicrobium halophilum TaxID=86666 RepID=A0A1G8R4A2_9BACI|nr:PQQ-binding-like beta-propeller repeat protein [Salimicrobium halophilum]SDJ11796.1 Outer membrane protein assembly factor BamB, contains PQQ-like beta-propeller repeat [Salimicrobium halophilum]
MKRYIRNYIVGVSFLLFFLAGAYSAEATFGPDSWLEYRLNDKNNPVYDEDGTDPLEAVTFETGDQIRSTPVVIGDRLFAGNHNTGEMFAFDIKSGELLWENQAPNWIHSEMIYQGGTVYVGFGNRFFENGIRGTGQSGVMAVDAETGETLWQTETDGEVMPTPVYHEGYVYAATGDRHLYKMEESSGEVEEKINLGHIVSMSSPNYYEDHIFVGGGAPRPYTFSAVDVEEDTVTWQTEMPDAFAGLDDVPPAISEDIVVTTALEGPGPLPLKQVYDNSGAVEAYKELVKSLVGNQKEYPEHVMYAMDTNNGELLWKKSLGSGEMVKNNKSGAPMIYDGRVYVGSPITETFYSYDLQTGEKQWEFRNTTMKAPPVADDGVVYFTNAEGYVHAMDAETGEEIGRKELGGTLAPSGPIIMNDTLIVGSQDSNVYALPVEEIQGSSDEFTTNHHEEKSMLSFVSVVYGAPTILLIVLMILGVAGVRMFRKKHHNK